MKKRNLNVQFNKEVIQHNKDANIQMDLMGSVMFVLFGLYDGHVEELDYADDSNKQRRMNVMYEQLARRGFLEKNAPEEPILWKLTPMGVEFVAKLRESHDKEEEIVTELEEKIAIEANPVVGGWIREYVQLFPEGMVCGKRLREGTTLHINRMIAFMKHYKYEKDLILKATKLYLEEQEASAEGHKFTRNSKYFIWKDNLENSDLATWCERAQEEGEHTNYNMKEFDVI